MIVRKSVFSRFLGRLSHRDNSPEEVAQDAAPQETVQRPRVEDDGEAPEVVEPQVQKNQ